MLRRVLDAGIGPDVHVIFANTGKEREETLDFVAECGDRWGVTIRWIEYADDGLREVTHATASRAGEPFAALIRKRGYLPNPGSPYCSCGTRAAQAWRRPRAPSGVRKGR